MLRKLFILPVCLVMAGSIVQAQSLDSLFKVLNRHASDDTARLAILSAIAAEYQYTAPIKGLEFAERAIELAQRLNRKKELINAYLLKGENLFLKGDYKLSLDILEKALTTYQETDDQLGIARCLNDLGKIYCYLLNYPKALEYFKKALAIDSLQDYRFETANVLSSIGWFYDRQLDLDNALVYYQQALEKFEFFGNKRRLARVLNNMGSCYYRLSNHPRALDCMQKALKINEALDNVAAIASNNVSLGDLYMQIYPPKALVYFNTALKLYRQLKANYSISSMLNSIGNAYTAQADSGRIIEFHKKALEYYDSALALNEEIDDQRGIAINLGNMAFNYSLSSDFVTAMKYLQKALSMNQQFNSPILVADNLENIALVYYTAPDSILVKLGINPSEKYYKAIENIKTAHQLYKNGYYVSGQLYALLRIHDTYVKAGHYDSAYTYYKRHIALRDSVHGVEKQKEILSNELKFAFSKKEDSLKFQQQLTDAKLKQQDLLAKQQQQQLALNENKLHLSNAERDLQKLAYLKTQTDLQNEQHEKQEKEKQLTLTEKEKLLQLANVKTLTQEKHLNALNQRQQWIYISGGLILLGFVLFYFFYRARLYQVRLKNQIAAEKLEQQRKEAEFQRQLGDISLSALRSQMNPHFIFNCLNSIKLYTTQNDTSAASEYLTKFSRLIRLVLENSRNDRITLAAEFDALRLYIEMEAMRFKEKLNYNIAINKEVDTDYIEIPPLLLQPYVENAIWHGLMQKEEGGKIDITADMEHEDSMLVINITDDGIGRARAAALMSKTATKHKSYGMKVTSERLALINQVYKTGANVAIYDLTDSFGQPAGTQVTIKIPLE